MKPRAGSMVARFFMSFLLIMVLAGAHARTRSQYGSIGIPYSDAPVISKAAFSLDGKLGAFVYPDGVTLLDFANLRERCLIHREGITALAFSADGTELAIAANGTYDPSPIGETAPFVEIQIIEVRTGAVTKRYPDARVMRVDEMAFTSGGALIAVVANPGPKQPYNRRLDGLFLWDVFAGRLTPLLPRGEAQETMGCFPAFIPGGPALVLLLRAVYKDDLKLYSTATASLVHKVDGSMSARFGPLAISEDGKMLAYGSRFLRGSPEILLYDLAKRKVVRKIRDLPVGMTSLVFLANGGLAALPGLPAQARLQAGYFPPFPQSKQPFRGVTIWNPGNGRLDKTLDFPEQSVVNVIVPGQNALASLAGGNWSLRDLQTGEVRGNIIADGTQCVSAASARPSAAVRKALQSFTIHRILAVSFLPDRPGILLGASDDGAVHLWSIATGNELQRNQFGSSADCVAISEDGRIAAVASEKEKSVFVLDKDSTDRQIPLTAFPQKAGALAASAAGEMLAIGSEDGTLGIWDVENQVLARQWKGHSAAVRSLAFSPNSMMLASSGDDRTLKLWSVDSGTMMQTVEGHAGKVNAVAFAPGSTALLASGGDDARILLWDVKGRSVLKRLNGHKGPVRSICFSPDGSLLLSGGDDSLQVWNVKTGKRIRVLMENSAEWKEGRDAPGQPVGYGSNDITILSIRFSADGKVVACGGTNETAVVWDTKTWGRRVLRPIDK